MIEGFVNDRLEATVLLEIYSTGGHLVAVNTVVDTGFSEDLTLPLSIVRRLGLNLTDESHVDLANGASAVFRVGTAKICWGGIDRIISVFVSENTPLIGMALLKGCNLNIDVLPGGPVIVVPRD